jgi:hypothetical protein
MLSSIASVLQRQNDLESTRLRHSCPSVDTSGNRVRLGIRTHTFIIWTLFSLSLCALYVYFCALIVTVLMIVCVLAWQDHVKVSYTLMPLLIEVSCK